MHMHSTAQHSTALLAVIPSRRTESGPIRDRICVSNRHLSIRLLNVSAPVSLGAEQRANIFPKPCFIQILGFCVYRTHSPRKDVMNGREIPGFYFGMRSWYDNVFY